MSYQPNALLCYPRTCPMPSPVLTHAAYASLCHFRSTTLYCTTAYMLCATPYCPTALAMSYAVLAYCSCYAIRRSNLVRFRWRRRRRRRARRCTTWSTRCTPVSVCLETRVCVWKRLSASVCVAVCVAVSVFLSEKVSACVVGDVRVRVRRKECA
eukprot:2563929-Rhodomonas_salina.1